MHEERNQNCKTQTKVELQVIPNNRQAENGCAGTIILAVTCDGSKLTKADSGRAEELVEEIWVTAKVTKTEIGQIPDIDVSVHERTGLKLIKADVGIA